MPIAKGLGFLEILICINTLLKWNILPVSFPFEQKVTENEMICREAFYGCPLAQTIGHHLLCLAEFAGVVLLTDLVCSYFSLILSLMPRKVILPVARQSIVSVAW